MLKLFISQPMRGKTDKEIMDVRQAILEEVKVTMGEDVELIDSFFKNAPADATPLWYLGQSILLLATADVVYFAKGWREARGCVIENICANEYNLLCIQTS